MKDFKVQVNLLRFYKDLMGKDGEFASFSEVSRASSIDDIKCYFGVEFTYEQDGDKTYFFFETEEALATFMMKLY